jgi:hypothetical protein
VQLQHCANSWSCSLSLPYILSISQSATYLSTSSRSPYIKSYAPLRLSLRWSSQSASSQSHISYRRICLSSPSSLVYALLRESNARHSKGASPADAAMSHRYGDYSFTTYGLLLTLFGALLAAVKGIATNRILVGRLKFHPLDLLLRMSRTSALFIASPALYQISDNICSYQLWHSANASSSRSQAENYPKSTHAHSSRRH